MPRFDAILEAKGDYICNIDSDDTIEGSYLEKLTLHIAKKNCIIRADNHFDGLTAKEYLLIFIVFY